MLTEQEEKDIKLFIENRIGRNIKSFTPITSRHGIKREHPKRVYKVRAGRNDYILYIAKNIFKEHAEELVRELNGYYPKIVLKTTLPDSQFEFVLYEYVIGEKLFNVLLDPKCSEKKAIIILAEISKYLQIKNKHLGKTISRKVFTTQLISLVSSFSEDNIANTHLRSIVEAKMRSLAKNIPDHLLIKRPVNFDFIPDNIIVTSNNKIKIIDLELVSSSYLHVIEPVRLAYYLAENELKRISSNDDFAKLFSNEYLITKLLVCDSKSHSAMDYLLQKYKIRREDYRSLILLFWICEQELHNKIFKTPVNSETIYVNERIISYLASDDFAQALFMSPNKSNSALQPAEARSVMDQLLNVTGEIEVIRSSKFFKIWQKYCRIREAIFQS